MQFPFDLDEGAHNDTKLVFEELFGSIGPIWVHDGTNRVRTYANTLHYYWM